MIIKDEAELTYLIARLTALNDSIGEGYCGYYEDYTKEFFQNDTRENKYGVTHREQAEEIIKLIKEKI